MRHIVPFILIVCFAVHNASAQKIPTYKKITLSNQFTAEGACTGDFNKDGIPDIAAGPYWYEGPDFTKKHEIYKVEALDPAKYSDNFGMFTGDFNGDGWDDIFICPHPGTQAYWYENPKGKEQHWNKVMCLPELGNESQMWFDIFGDGRLGPIYNMNKKLGFGTFEIKGGKPEWTFHQVSNEDERYQRYTHGIGAGDINGDGRIDLLDSKGWWEQPKDKKQVPWTFHPFDFGPAPAHMLVYDVDGDGLNDVITAHHCHLYGLCWYQQVRDGSGNITFKRHEIMPIEPDLNSDALRFTQMHAFALADFNGDGLMDFVTGKRYYAHGPKGDKEADAPAVLYWFELKRDGKGGAKFIPHKIDDDSGVGTQVWVADLNGDKVPDVVVCNKKGTFVFLSQ
ncbi:MAG: VCBS repeat-containing protein [Planctomycetaceae bacterium]|nr:VCBS repeat-containing protein [Planctomycetaceae bacterium]